MHHVHCECFKKSPQSETLLTLQLVSYEAREATELCSSPVPEGPRAHTHTHNA